MKRTPEDWKFRKECQRWVRHALTNHEEIVGWAWLLIPSRLPWKCWPILHPYGVEA